MGMMNSVKMVFTLETLSMESLTRSCWRTILITLKAHVFSS